MAFSRSEPLLSIANNCYSGDGFDIFKLQQYSDWFNCCGQRQEIELNQDYPVLRRKELLRQKAGLRMDIGLLT